MISIGCHSLNFGPKRLPEALRQIHELGFRRVDVAVTGGGGKAQVNPLAAMENPRAEAAEMRSLCEKYALELDEMFMCHVPVDGVGVQPNDPDEQVRARMLNGFERLCRYASAAGFKSIMGVPGVVQNALGVEGSMERSIVALRRMVRIAADYGLAYRVEPHRGSIIDTPEAAVQLVRDVPGLTFTLDFLHFVAYGIPQERVMPLLDYAGHLHARQARDGWPKCPVELGTIDYGAIIGRLRELEWSGTITLEFWNGPREDAAGINPVFQNVLMAYQLQHILAGDSKTRQVLKLY